MQRLTIASSKANSFFFSFFRTRIFGGGTAGLPGRKLSLPMVESVGGGDDSYSRVNR